MNIIRLRKNQVLSCLKFAPYAVAFIYTCLRAYNISVYHDEAFTYIVHAKESYTNILLFYGAVSPNSHILNTFLIKLFTQVFGLSEFIIRIPALIGHGLYLVGTYMVLRMFLRKSLFILGSCLLVLNPFLLELFSVARGYALALGLVAFAIYYFLNRITLPSAEIDRHNGPAALFMLALASMANFAFLHVYVVMFAILAGYELAGVLCTKERKGAIKDIAAGYFKRIIPYLHTLIPLIIFCVKPVAFLARHKRFFNGGTTGFWEDTVLSLVNALLYGKGALTVAQIILVKFGVFVILGIAGVILIHKWFFRKEWNVLDRYTLAVLSFLLACAVEIVLQNKLIHTRYIVGRHAAFFIPLFLILFLLLWESLSGLLHKKFKKIIDVVLSGFVVIAIAHFLLCANISYVRMNLYDSSTKTVMQHIMHANDSKVLKEKTVSIGTQWYFIPAIHFYMDKYKLEWGKTKKGQYDFYYLKEDPAQEQDNSLRIIKRFPYAKTFLAVPR